MRAEAGAAVEQSCARSEAKLFLDPDRTDLYLGNERIDRYLSRCQQPLALRVRVLLRGLDYSMFALRYSGHGRKAIHPCNMVGLIVYGTLKGRASLRELEELAQTDIGAMWLSGGHLPDHSTIGKFVQLHGELLGEEFFTSLTRSLLSQQGVTRGAVAADGTVVEAAASRFRLLKLEAARLAAESARAEATRAPGDEQAAQRAAWAENISAQATERSRRRAQQGGVAAETRIAPGEPEAVVQRLKSGPSRPAYKPSLAAHERGWIVGQHVDPSSERAAVAPMLAQHQAIFGAPPARLLLDAGYPSLPLLRQLCELDIDVLAPSGPTRPHGGWERRGVGGRFAKSEFHYDAQRDLYRCPAGRELVKVGRGRNQVGPYRRYRGTACGGCPLASRCTTSAQGRTLNRYEDDELKEAMAAVLSQPAARRAYRKRSTVERVIACLRRDGLRRFRRRGLKGVRVEFALYCIAYNLGCAAAHSALFCVLIFTRQTPSTADWQILAAIRITR
jgi:transposase